MLGYVLWEADIHKNFIRGELCGRNGGTFLVAQWLRIWASRAGGLIAATKMLQTTAQEPECWN